MRRFLFLAAALALAASGARAAENDIVFVDIEQVLRQSESGKRIQTKSTPSFRSAKIACAACWRRFKARRSACKKTR